jgi:NAD(P)-dependent dehydrogenase (short-subunit alcohol dehydrogenase family)
VTIPGHSYLDYLPRFKQHLCCHSHIQVVQKETAMSVKDRVAIVTGAGGGLGRLYALALAERGAKVVVNDYGGGLDGVAGTITRAQVVVDEIVKLGGVARPDGHDVSNPTHTKAIVADAIKAFGRVDILVNNAGILGNIHSHDDVNAADFMRVLEISVLGTSLMMSAVYPTMEKQKFGRIINISSNAVYGFGAGGDCAYAASKGATLGISRDLGRFSVKHGIKINCVMPSGFSRMTAIAEGTKKLTTTYFPAKAVAPFIVALASDECAVSGEVFSVGAGIAAREVLSTFPGAVSKTPEGYLENWDKVMGENQEIYSPVDTMDHVKYLIRNATGKEMEDIPGLGLL